MISELAMLFLEACVIFTAAILSTIAVLMAIHATQEHRARNREISVTSVFSQDQDATSGEDKSKQLIR